MIDRVDFLEEHLSGYLDRKTVPPSLADKPESQVAEVRALMRVILSYAPALGYEGWWETVERHLGRNAKTRSWPIESEIDTACAANRPVRVVVDNTRRPAVSVEADRSARINAQRIRDGQVVGVGALWGRSAHEMIALGLVSEHDLEPYREGVLATEITAFGAEVAEQNRLDRARIHDATRPGGDEQRGFGASFGARRMPAPQFTPVEHLAPPPPSDDPRPYTEAELARMRALRSPPVADPEPLPENWREEMEA